MKNQNKPIIFPTFLFLIVLSLSYPSSISAQEVEDEREFDYIQGSGKGPGHWGKIKKEWAACDNGDLQSPIDLSNHRVKVIPKLGKLKRSYYPCNATVKNRGHDISVYWVGNAGSIIVSDVVYNLQQSHWHSPSEHSINGIRYDLELHMVHLSSDPNVKNKIAVVGQLYKIGPPDPFLSQLSREISIMADQKDERNVGVINPSEIKIGARRYYRYLGSLTVPPCTEGVIWTISKKIRTVSREQVKLLREAVHEHSNEVVKGDMRSEKLEMELPAKRPAGCRPKVLRRASQLSLNFGRVSVSRDCVPHSFAFPLFIGVLQ